MHCRFLSARKFLEKASGVRVRATCQADLAKALRDGDLLCRVALLLHDDPSMAPVASRYSGGGREFSEAQVNENFSRFSLACALLQVHSHYVLTKEDVLAGRMNKLVNCILELERYAKNMNPPPRYPSLQPGDAGNVNPGSPSRTPLIIQQSPSAAGGQRNAAATRRTPTARRNIITSPLSQVRRVRRTPSNPGSVPMSSSGTGHAAAAASAAASARAAPSTPSTASRRGGREAPNSSSSRRGTPSRSTFASFVGFPMGLLDLVGGAPTAAAAADDGSGAGAGAAASSSEGVALLSSSSSRRGASNPGSSFAKHPEVPSMKLAQPVSRVQAQVCVVPVCLCVSLCVCVVEVGVANEFDVHGG